MLWMAASFVVPALLDVTPASAVRSLAEKKSYAFAVDTKVTGVKRVDLDGGMTGAVRKPDIVVAHLRNGTELVRRGATALYGASGEWKTLEELKREKHEDDVASLVTLLAPAQELSRHLAGLARQKSTEKLGDTECISFAGPMSADAATALAKETCSSLSSSSRTPRSAGSRAGGPSVPFGGRARDDTTPVKPKQVVGTAKLLVGTANELPHELSLTVTFKVSLKANEETDVTVTRTLALSDFDSARLEIPEDVRKRLGIADP